MLNILITGAKGFIGKNLISELNNIREGKVKNRPISKEITIFEFDVDSNLEDLDEYCQKADFVFHLAGVNRPKETSEFMTGNFGLTSLLLEKLEKYQNRCPVLLSSSTQAALDNPYGQSKKAGEDLLFQYGKERQVPVLVYRFPNVFGKWSRPNYNSAIATFCHNIAAGLPITVNDRTALLTLVYIDDVITELINALAGNPHRNDPFCRVPVEHQATLGKIADLLYSFRASREERSVPDMSDSFVQKLYATYLSFLPKNAFSYPLQMNSDDRGSFTEIIRTSDRGQFSVNISKPHIVKGNHWHHSKNEKFVVVAGKGVIRFRNPNSDEILEYYVSGDKIEVVDIPPGYSHNIENLGEVDLVTFMWASECFDPNRPDTFFLPIS